MVKQFDSLKEIQKYYDKETNTYVFEENGYYIDLVVFNFNLSIDANIEAFDIKAHDIIANNVYAHDINAWDINAKDISYFSVCFARGNIKCRSIKSNYPNAKHFVLNGELEVGEEENQ